MEKYSVSDVEQIIKKHMKPLEATGYFFPNIPEGIEHNAMKSYVSLDEDEYIIFIEDWKAKYTEKSGEKGWCLSNKAIYWNREKPLRIEYSAIKECCIKKSHQEHKLLINDGEFVISNPEHRLLLIKKVLNKIIKQPSIRTILGKTQ